MVAIVLKYKKYFLIIMLLHILCIVGHYEGYHLELYEINKE